MEKKARMAAPDMIKIAATIFVILIHHKKNYSNLTMVQHNLFFSILSAFLIVLGVVLFLRKLSKSDSDKKRCFDALFLPIVAAVGFVFLKRFAVAFFLMISGYLMSGTLDKSEHSFEWYRFRKLVSRIIRFYLPLVPVFILALLYKMFVLSKKYSLLEVVVRFFLGGFRPGGYYVAILVQLVLLLPVIHAVVRKYKFKGVIMCVCFTLIYDVLATVFGMNDTLYKFLIFRLTTHIAFGVHMRYADFRKNKANYIMFVVGLVYVVCCVFTDIYIPKLFFRWRDVSFMTAFFLAPVIVLFINRFGHISYNDSRLSRLTLAFANATYHIFLVQLLYYTTVGFAFNEYINNAVITLGLNVILTVPTGILYFKLMNPFENRIMLKINGK